jgi:hypothetical protein
VAANDSFAETQSSHDRLNWSIPAASGNPRRELRPGAAGAARLVNSVPQDSNWSWSITCIFDADEKPPANNVMNYSREMAMADAGTAWLGWLERAGVKLIL